MRRLFAIIAALAIPAVAWAGDMKHPSLPPAVHVGEPCLFGQTNGSCVGGVPDPLVINSLTVHTITPKNHDGTDAIGPFNGARNNEINIGDQPGFSSWMGTLSCSTVNGNTAATCASVGTTPLVAGNYVAIYGAGPTPSVTVPTGIQVGSIHTLTAPGGADSTTLASGCTTQNAYAWTTATSAFVGVSNIGMYEVGDSIGVAGVTWGGGSAGTATILTINPGDVGVTVNAAANQTVNGIVMSGAGCGITRHYEAFAIDAKGGWSAPTAVQNLTTSTANALTQSNFIDFQVATQSNAIAYVLAGYEGATATDMHIIDVQVPSYSWALTTNTNWWDNDQLVAVDSTKRSPSTITMHDYGTAWGRDFIQGFNTITGRQAGTYGAVPAGAVNQILFTKITSISGTTVNLADTPSQTGTFTLVADEGPVFNAAYTADCDTNGVCGAIFFPSYKGTNQGYSIVSPISMTNGVGLLLLGEGVLFNGEGVGNGTPAPKSIDGQFNYRGPIGGVAWGLYSQTRPQMENMNINALTSMGVCVDIDTLAGGLSTSTAPQISHISCGQSSIGLRLSNVSTDNSEFGLFSDINWNVELPSGFEGIMVNMSNSLRHTFINDSVWGQIGFQDNGAGVQFIGGQLGGPYYATAIWAQHYESEDAMHFIDMRSEHDSRIFYAPAANGGAGIVDPNFSNDNWQDLRVLGDGIVEAFPGSGAVRIDKDFWNTSTWGHFNNNCSDPQITSPITTWQPTTTSITSTASTRDALATPFSATTTIFVHSSGDGVLNCSWGEISAVAPPIASINFGQTCATLTASGLANPGTNSIASSFANCSITNGGGTLLIPTTGNDFSGTLSICGNHSKNCCWFMYEAHPGSAPGSTIVSPSHADESNTNGWACSGASANPMSLNVVGDPASTGILITDNLQPQSTGGTMPSPLNFQLHAWQGAP